MSERPRTMLERPVMREAFRKELRARLMSEAAVALAPRDKRTFVELLFAQRWLRPAFATAAVLVLAVAGATTAAASSLPGQPLYAVKRLSENVHVALTFDDVARLRLLSELADRRLDELAQLAAQRSSSAPTATTEFADAVEKFQDEVDRLRAADSDEKREAAQAVAEAARNKHRAVLDAVKEKVPESARERLEQAIERESADDSAGGDGDRTPNVTPRESPAQQRTTPRPSPRGQPSARPTSR